MMKLGIVRFVFWATLYALCDAFLHHHGTHTHAHTQETCRQTHRHIETERETDGV